MRRTNLNFLVDLLTLLACLGMAGTGSLLRFVLPPGTRGGRGLTLWELDRHEWGDIHFWTAVALLALLILHVVLHWTWVCVTLRGWFGRATESLTPAALRRQTVYGVVFLLALVLLVGGFLWLGSSRVVEGGEGGGGQHGRGYRGGRGPAPMPVDVDAR
jgi:hypothetical protein